MRYYFLLCCIHISLQISAQTKLPEFGNYSDEEVNLKECAFDKDAGAIILFDEGVSSAGMNYSLITRRRVRLKILNQREISRGDISILFYSNHEFEYIDSIKAVSFTPEGSEYKLTRFEKESIYTEKQDNFYSKKKFAIPNVKVGSIIEYEYYSHKKTYESLRNWAFQAEIPTLKSCYLLQVPALVDVQYSVQKKSTYPITIKNTSGSSTLYFEMNSLPGLRHEPFMDAASDYLQRVDFQLASVTSRFGKTEINSTWRTLATSLTTDKNFGGAIKKTLTGTEEIKSIVSDLSTDSARINAIYSYVRDHFTWNGYHSIYATGDIKKIWDEKNGTAGEINLLLINLLRTFNIAALPLLVAERNFGKIDVSYPFLDRFNKVVAYARDGDKIFIMDATQKFSPPELPPSTLLNTIGFVVDGKNSKLIGILNKGYAYNNKITINASINNKNVLAGSAIIASTGYARQVRKEQIKTDPKKFISQTLQEPGSELEVDNCTYINLDNDTQPLIQEISFHNEFNVSGGFIFFTYNLFTGLSRNPFTARERFTNINFGYPYNISAVIKVQLPEKIKVDKMPDDKSVMSPDASTVAYRSVKMDGSTLIINIGFRQTNTIIKTDQYDDLRSLYNQITELLNEPIIIKTGE